MVINFALKSWKKGIKVSCLWSIYSFYLVEVPGRKKRRVSSWKSLFAKWISGRLMILLRVRDPISEISLAGGPILNRT